MVDLIKHPEYKKPIMIKKNLSPYLTFVPKTGKGQSKPGVSFYCGALTLR